MMKRVSYMGQCVISGCITALLIISPVCNVNTFELVEEFID